MMSVADKRAAIEDHHAIEQRRQTCIRKNPHDGRLVIFPFQKLKHVADDLVLQAVVQSGKRPVEDLVVRLTDQRTRQIELLPLG